MKKKWLVIIGSVLFTSMLIVGIAYAFSVGNVDGVWGTIDTYDETPTVIDVVGVIGTDPGTYWDGGGNLRTANRTLVRQPTVCDGDPDGSSTLAGWTGYPDQTYTYLGSHVISETCSTTDLFISEYVETTSGDPIRRALEIYNGTGRAVDISNYAIYIFNSGSSTPTSQFYLSNALLADGDVWVIGSRTDIGTATINQVATLSFDGDDAVALVRGRAYPNDAECSRWASGGTSTAMWSDNWWDQTNWTGTNPGTFNQDENLVLYGRETFWTGSAWAQITCANTTLAGQSGFGFDGRNDTVTPPAKTPFYLGQFTHYNRPVFAWAYGNQSDSNAFNQVKLTVSVPITCNDNVTSTNFNFDSLFHLEETSNTAGQCEYGEAGDEPCPDKVWITQPTNLAAQFICPEGPYTVNILGFTSEGLNGAHCSESFNPASVSTDYITQEFSSNTACLWAEIDQPLADVAPAKTCQAFSTQQPFYRIVITNAGPGSSQGVEILDTLPDGTVYATDGRTWTSTLTTSSGTNPQGTCTISGKTILCRLLTPLPDFQTDSSAKWTVEIPVQLVVGSYINTVTAYATTVDPNTANNTVTALCESTSADLISFTGARKPDGIFLNWETASEVDLIGFNLIRAEDPSGVKVQINPNLIPVKIPGSLSGTTYEYLDDDIDYGIKYFYWLEVYSADRMTISGPLEVNAFWEHYLPMMIR